MRPDPTEHDTRDGQPHYNVRRLAITEASAAARVAAAAISRTWANPDVDMGSALEVYASDSAWRALIDERIALGAFSGGVLVGVATLHETGEKEGYFAMLNVLWPRCGIGRMLTRERLRLAEEIGMASVYAHVDKANTASLANLLGCGFSIAEDFAPNTMTLRRSVLSET